MRNSNMHQYQRFESGNEISKEVSPYFTLFMIIVFIAIIGGGYWFFFIRTVEQDLQLREGVKTHYFETSISTFPADYLLNDDKDFVNSLTLSVNGETDLSKVEGAVIDSKNEVRLAINKYTYTLSNGEDSVSFDVEVVDNKEPMFLYYPVEIRIVVDAIDFTFPEFFAAIDPSGAKITTTDNGNVNINKTGTYHMNVKAIDSFGNENGGDIKVIVVSTETAFKALTGKGGTLTRMANGEIPMSKALLELLKEKPVKPTYTNPIVRAALAQLGSHDQCSTVVNNSLKAVNVNAVKTNVSINGSVTYYLGTESFFNVGTEVPFANAQPGDVLYYPNNGSGGTHAGIYIGNGMALQGNVSGTTMITYAVFPGLPTPRVIRVNYDREKYGY